MTKIDVRVEVDLAQFDDEDIREEFEARGLGPGGSHEDGQWRLLADLIAAGEKQRALEMCAEMSSGAFNVATVLMLTNSHNGVRF